MASFLQQLAEYEVTSYYIPKYTQKREMLNVDFIWYDENDKEAVAIEHENDSKSVFDNEIPKLLALREDILKILITYVRNKHWPGASLAERLREKLRTENRPDEFLLIIGDWSYQPRWAGYLYYPDIIMRALV